MGLMARQQAGVARRRVLAFVASASRQLLRWALAQPRCVMAIRLAFASASALGATAPAWTVRAVAGGRSRCIAPAIEMQTARQRSTQ